VTSCSYSKHACGRHGRGSPQHLAHTLSLGSWKVGSTRADASQSGDRPTPHSFAFLELRVCHNHGENTERHSLRSCSDSPPGGTVGAWALVLGPSRPQGPAVFVLHCTLSLGPLWPQAVASGRGPCAIFPSLGCFVVAWPGGLETWCQAAQSPWDRPLRPLPPAPQATPAHVPGPAGRCDSRQMVMDGCRHSSCR
jgi:hypothetical protein